MEGKIISFRRGNRTINPNHALIEAKEVKSRADVTKLIGKKIELPIKNGKIIGKIASAHGNKGTMRAIFKKAITRDMIGKKVTISD